MIDREKVIAGLTMLADRKNDDTCQGLKCCKIAEDALTLLKEQKPILLENQHKPYGISTNANSPWISRCPKCNKKVEGKQTKFCKYCGQAVKWE